MTERLFDADSYLTAFEATVVACRQTENGYAVVLDRTAFFPEGGGQKGDTGFLNGLPVRDTQETPDGEIEHDTDAPFTVGQRVFGQIDGDTRFVRMQNHTAEHIFSGHVFRAFGLKNVGFHLGDGYMTFDYDGVLTKSDICLLEQMTMKTVFAALPVKTWFPEHPDEYEYRSKKELTGRIRLVEIPGVDLCACCAPHLHTTAEVGCVKVLSCERYKGGVRLTVVAGSWAMREFTMAWDTVTHLSALFTLPPQETARGADRLMQKLKDSEEALKQMRREEVLRLAQESAEPFLFVTEPTFLPLAADALRARFDCPVAAFCGEEETGYRFMLLFSDPLVKDRAVTLWHASGGGKPGTMQGMAHAGRDELKKLWES